MTGVRILVRLFALGCLVCQLNTLALVPSIQMVSATSSSAQQACRCPHGAHGVHAATCPMHKRAASAAQCRMRSARSRADAALLSILGPLGLVPSTGALINPPLSETRALVEGGTAIERVLSPDSPPPRA
jgi:hypothetical protein